MMYQLKYIAGSGGEFVWHSLMCSPDCVPSFPDHPYRTSAEYIINDIYRPTRQPKDWNSRCKLLADSDLTEWVDMDDHEWHDPRSNRFYSPFFIVNYQEERYLKKEDIIKFKIANFCLLALTINIWLTFVQH